jgi:hypothetical protein
MVRNRPVYLSTNRHTQTLGIEQWIFPVTYRLSSFVSNAMGDLVKAPSQKSPGIYTCRYFKKQV